MRRLTIISLLAALLCALFAGSAQAKPGQTVIFDAPGNLLNPATRDETLTKLDGLGVHALRVVLHWADVAPASTSRARPTGDLTDPARYDWSRYAPVLAAAQARGWPVTLTVSSPVPRWATQGAVDQITRPRPSDFQAFMTAIGRQFGDQVATWSIWNEPNHPQFLQPQYVNGRPYSPGLYRQLFFAGRAGLTAAGLPNAQVLFGETAPRGQGRVIAPLVFLRGVLCLSSSYKKTSGCPPLPANGYAHHPYTTAAGPFFVPANRDDVTLGVLGRLKTALDRAARAGAIAKHLPIYLTEFGVQSTPDTFTGVSLAKQSDYRSIAEHLAWADPRIAGFSQYLLTDDKHLNSGPKYRRYPGFESGLMTYEGEIKPSYGGFRLPLVATPSGSRIALWGLVRPATGATSVVVQQADRGKAFKDLSTVTTRADGSWTAKASARRGRTWRVVWTAPGGAVFRGSATLAYHR